LGWSGRFVSCSWRTAVICLTASISPSEERAILEAGAVACLSKEEELPTIVAAIRQAARIREP